MSAPCPECGRSDFLALAGSGAIGGAFLGSNVGRLIADVMGMYLGGILGLLLGVWIAWKASHSSADHDHAD
jgi:hypothetical protein